MKLLVVLTASLTALALAQRPSECRKGPRAWCANRDLAIQCGKLKYYEKYCESRAAGGPGRWW